MRSVSFWSRFKRNRGAVVGLVFVGLVLLLAILADALAPFGPLQTGVVPSLQPPQFGLLLGSDDLGRDGLSGLLFGARTALVVGLLAGAIAIAIGTTLGVASGFVGGRLDYIVMRVLEAFQVMPIFFVMIVVVSVFGTSVLFTSLIIGLLAWPRIARLVRAEALALRETEFVLAATALGNRKLAIAYRHVLPNALATGLTAGSLEIANAILLEAGLSFLGFSDPNAASWGAMLNNARQFISRAWWLAAFPGAAIAITVLGFNLVTEGITDALNPRLTRR